MKTLRVVPPLVALVFALTACGADSSGEKPADQGSESQQLMLKYAQCMRDNGVELPDPVDGSAGSMYEGVDQASAAFQSADEVCSPILQGVVDERKNEGGGDDAAQHEELLALAKCLRDNGIDVPDPVPGTSKPFGDSLDRTDPAVAQALGKCTQARTEPGK
ncbi:hypothetical protein [Actinophytocola sediminis]